MTKTNSPKYTARDESAIIPVSIVSKTKKKKHINQQEQKIQNKI